jgi:hypothetical protein
MKPKLCKERKATKCQAVHQTIPKGHLKMFKVDGCERQGEIAAYGRARVSAATCRDAVVRNVPSFVFANLIIVAEIVYGTSSGTLRYSWLRGKLSATCT